MECKEHYALEGRMPKDKSDMKNFQYNFSMFILCQSEAFSMKDTLYMPEEHCFIVVLQILSLYCNQKIYIERNHEKGIWVAWR